MIENQVQSNKLIDIMVPTREFRKYTLEHQQIQLVNYYLNSANVIEIVKK